MSRITGTIQSGPRLMQMIKAQPPNWIEFQKRRQIDFMDLFIGLIALTCGIASIVLAGAVLAVLFE